MPERSLGKAVRQLLRTLAPQSGESDGHLLHRFAQFDDEEAFEILLERHGPMVWRTCQRIVRQPADAEDAFQAAFLVLCRKARSIGKRESLASWLHQVAYRIALRVNTRSPDQPIDDRHVVAVASDPAATMIHADRCRLLDEALGRLPAKYRVPLILCCLEGKSKTRAAVELGWAEGTVSSRLARGKELLRASLLRRGVTLSAAALATLLVQESTAQSVPWSLAQATLKTKSLILVGEAAATSGLAAKAVILAQGAMKAMLLTKIKVATVAFMAVSVLGIGSGVVMNGVLAKRHAAVETNDAPQGVAKADRPTADGREPKTARTDRYGDPLPEGAIARMGSTRFRHGAMATRLAYSPDGKTIASWHNDGTLCLWEAGSGKEICRYRIPHAVLQDLRLLPNGKSVAVLKSTVDDTRLWDFAPGTEPPPKLKPNPGSLMVRAGDDFEQFFNFAVSPDGKLLAAGSWGYQDRKRLVQVWEVQTGKELKQLKVLRSFERNQDNVQSLAFSPDGTILVSAARIGNGKEHLLTMWEVATGKELRHLHVPIGLQADLQADVRFIFSADGRTLAVWLAENRIRLYDAGTGRELRQLQWRPAEGGKGAASCVAFSADGKMLVSADGDNIVRSWEATGKELLTIATGHKYGIISLAIAPDGKTAATGAQDAVVRLWDLATGKEIHPVEGDESRIASVVFSIDGKTLATVSQENDLRLWETATGRELQRDVRHNRFDVLAFSSDGRFLAKDPVGKALTIRDLLTGKELNTIEDPDGRIGSNSAMFSPDGKSLGIAAGDGIVRLWNIATGREVRQLRGHGRRTVIFAFSSDGKTIASASWGGTNPDDPEISLRLWDAETGKQFRQLPPNGEFIYAIAISPDGKTVASAGYSGRNPGPDFASAVRLYDVASGQELRRFPGEAGGDSSPEDWRRRLVRKVAFSPDGRSLATAEGNGSVMIYEVATGKLREKLAGHHGAVKSLRYSLDGHFLASSGADFTALIWDMTGAARLPTRDELNGLWAELAGDAVPQAYRAVQRLAGASRQAVPFLKERLRPVPASTDPKQLAQLIADLDNDQFAVRDKATAELAKLGESAETALRKMFQDQSSADMRRRATELLEKIEAQRRLPPSSEWLRNLRALEVLERAATTESKQMLDDLANGAPLARLTQEAKASFDRLAKQRVATPVTP